MIILILLSFSVFHQLAWIALKVDMLLEIMKIINDPPFTEDATFVVLL